MVDYLIITVLRLETDAVTRQFAQYQQLTDNSGLRTFRCHLTGNSRDAPTVIVISIGKSGRVEAAVATAKAIAKWKPRTVLLVGVGATIPGRAQLGDVLVASQIVDDSVRHDKADGATSARTEVYRMSKRMRAHIQTADQTDWRNGVKGIFASITPTVVEGAILSTDRAIRDLGGLQHVRSTFRDLSGVDMESGGVAAALNDAQTSPDLLVIRGVAEILEDRAKHVDLREGAAWAAAAFAVAIIKVALPHSGEVSPPAIEGESGTAEPFVIKQTPMPEEEQRPLLRPEAANDRPQTIQEEKSTTPPLAEDPHGPRVAGNGAWLKKDSLHFSRSPLRMDSCLRADQYASVLAKLFERARGEFFFGIFGHWGRGKTYLMERVQQLLERPPVTASFRWLPERVKKILGIPSPQYRCVWFKAWKYPTTPELWIHLYETLVEAALKGSWLEALARTVRVNIVRYGLGPLTTALWALAVALIPIGLWLKLAEPLQLVVSVIGVIGVLRLGKLFQGMRQTVDRLSEKYLGITRHSERLGLQQTIGRDLEYLLHGWIPEADPKIASGDSNQAWKKVTPWWRQFLLGMASVAVGVALTLAFWPSPDSRLFDTIQLGMPAWLVWSFGSLWGGLVIVTWLCVKLGGRAVTRVVLIIDDLDRCAPDHLLQLVESLKLLLEDPTISDRVQVAFLVEEEVLATTVLKKYERVLQTKTVNSYTERRIVQENLEKLILGHLRLPPLSPLEVAEILNHFAHPNNTRPGSAKLPGTTASALLAASAAKSTSGKKDELTSAAGLGQGTAPTATAEKPAASRNSQPATPNAIRPEPDSVFDAEEFVALGRAMLTLLKKKEAAILGPRAIQSFLLRFQLARLLLDARGVILSPEEVAETLALAWGEAPHSYLPRSPIDELNMVTREVM